MKCILNVYKVYEISMHFYDDLFKKKEKNYFEGSVGKRDGELILFFRPRPSDESADSPPSGTMVYRLINRTENKRIKDKV